MIVDLPLAVTVILFVLILVTLHWEACRGLGFWMLTLSSIANVHTVFMEGFLFLFFVQCMLHSCCLFQHCPVSQDGQ